MCDNNNKVLGLVSASCATAAGYMVKTNRFNTLMERVSLGFLTASSLTSLYFLGKSLYHKRSVKSDSS